MKLNYTDQGAGQPVILLHGMFGSLSNLGNLARDLATVYRVISADLLTNRKWILQVWLMMLSSC
jgi:esterase